MANNDEQQSVGDASSNAAESLEELLGNEQYVYQGKLYSRKRLYRGSSARKLILVVYLVVMIAVMGGVAAWSFGFSFTLPSFLLGVDEEAAPTVRVPERVVAPPPQTPAPEVASTTMEQATSTEGVASTTVTVSTSTEAVATTTSPASPATQVSSSTPPAAQATATTTATTSAPANTSATVVP